MTSIDKIFESVKAIEERISFLRRVNLDLYSKGWIGQGDGRGVPCTYYRDDKYLVLVWAGGGSRSCLYIGSDIDKVNDALRGVSRQREYLRNEQEIKRLAGELSKIDNEILLVAFRLKSVVNSSFVLG